MHGSIQKQNKSILPTEVSCDLQMGGNKSKQTLADFVYPKSFHLPDLQPTNLLLSIYSQGPECKHVFVKDVKSTLPLSVAL